MGECLDYHVGERVLVLYELERAGTTVGLDSSIAWVWETHVDVRVGDHVLRVPRESVDSDLDRPVMFATAADEAIPVELYEPLDEEAEHQ